MEKQRIEYIDWLKGLSIICVVWFHCPHPDWINFSFRMPLFFMLSGVFFKTVPFPVYAARKTNQLLVPFLFFYLLYFAFMAVVWLGLEHPLNEFTLLDSLLDLFGAHKEDTCLLVNSPLWFILALINLQLITYALKFTLRRRWLIMLVALGISALGIWHMEHRDTYFMFGRSLRYLGYYVFGHLYGKQLLGIIERDLKSRLTLWGVALTLLAAGAIGTFGGFAGREAWTYLFNSALVVSLIVLFRYVCRVPALRFFHFYGRNSYAVLGIHYMLIQTIYLILIPAFGMPSPAKGVLILLFVLLTMVPVINGFNRYAPQLVGKKPAIPFPILQRA